MESEADIQEGLRLLAQHRANAASRATWEADRLAKLDREAEAKAAKERTTRERIEFHKQLVTNRFVSLIGKSLVEVDVHVVDEYSYTCTPQVTLTFSDGSVAEIIADTVYDRDGDYYDNLEIEVHKGDS